MSIFPVERYGKIFNDCFTAVRGENIDESPQEAAECEGCVFGKQVEDFFQETNQEEDGIINKEAEFQLSLRVVLGIHPVTTSFGDDERKSVTSKSRNLPLSPFKARDPTFCTANKLSP